MTYLPSQYTASPYFGGQEGEGEGRRESLWKMGDSLDWAMWVLAHQIGRWRGGELFSGDEDEVPENISQVFFKLGRCHSSEQRKFVFEIMLCFVFNKAKNNHDIYCVVNYFIA